MIYVEQHFLHPKTLLPTSSYIKAFDLLSEFNAFYKIAKADPYCLINVMKYNPNENPGQKSHFDAKLFSVKREMPL